MNDYKGQNNREQPDELERRLEEEKMEEVLPIAEAAQLEKQDTSQNFQSGYSEIDDCLKGGFREGDFTIITGVPGDGKTTLARMFTLNFADKEIPTMWFSHEMTIKEQWEAFQEMGADQSLIAYVPTELHDDVDWMKRHIDYAIDKYNVKAVFIDTLGDVVKTAKTQAELSNYATHLAQICKDLKSYAVNRHIMIFAVAHAVKNTRTRTNETTNADIANSNGISAAATNIFHIWRDEKLQNRSYIKIGKSRRVGQRKNWKYTMQFQDHKLFIQERYRDEDEQFDEDFD